MCDGYGNLLADESTKVGEADVTLRDDDGEAILDNSGAPGYCAGSEIQVW